MQQGRLKLFDVVRGYAIVLVTTKEPSKATSGYDVISFHPPLLVW